MCQNQVSNSKQIKIRSIDLILNGESSPRRHVAALKHVTTSPGLGMTQLSIQNDDTSKQVAGCT